MSTSALLEAGTFATPACASEVSGTGDIFGITADPLFFEIVLTVPDNYVSGEALSGTATYENETFASLGMDIGSYTWSWGVGPGARWSRCRSRLLAATKTSIAVSHNSNCQRPLQAGSLFCFLGVRCDLSGWCVICVIHPAASIALLGPSIRLG